MSQTYERLAALYDQEWGTFSTMYLAFIDQVQKRFDVHPQSVLDLACGTGNLVAALEERNMHAIGLDSSTEMIQRAQAKYPQHHFIHGSMTEFALGQRFDLITCAFDSINYLLEPAQLSSMFASVRSHMHNKSLFLFDANTPLLFEHKQHGTLNRTINGETLEQILSYDRATQIATTEFVFEDGAREVHVQKGYAVDDIRPLLMANEIHLSATWENTEGAEATPQSERVFYVATVGNAE